MKLRFFLLIVLSVLSMFLGRKQVVVPACHRVLSRSLCHAQPHCRWSFLLSECVSRHVTLVSRPAIAVRPYLRTFGVPVARPALVRGVSRPVAVARPIRN